MSIKQYEKKRNLIDINGNDIIYSCQIITVFPICGQCQYGFGIESSGPFAGTKLLGRITV